MGCESRDRALSTRDWMMFEQDDEIARETTEISKPYVAYIRADRAILGNVTLSAFRNANERKRQWRESAGVSVAHGFAPRERPSARGASLRALRKISGFNISRRTARSRARARAHTHTYTHIQRPRLLPAAQEKGSSTVENSSKVAAQPSLRNEV